MDTKSITTNGSLDSRSYHLIPDLPRSVLSPSKGNKNNEKKDENKN
jgi:hypothetical protein